MLLERDLVDRMGRGEQRAFEQFFDAFATRRSSLDAAALDDIVQNIVINAMRSLGTHRGESTLLRWLCQICRNQLSMRVRTINPAR